jgi:hypothetical protein
MRHNTHAERRRRSLPRARQIGTHALVALDAHIAGYGATLSVPASGVLCGS